MQDVLCLVRRLIHVKRPSTDFSILWRRLINLLKEEKTRTSNDLTLSELTLVKAKLNTLSRLRPLHTWGDSDGPVLWWLLPVSEPPFHVGTPTDSDWPWDPDEDLSLLKIYWSRIPEVTQ